MQYSYLYSIEYKLAPGGKTHLEDPVDSHNWSFIIYGSYIDINHKRQALLPDICIIGHHCKIISHGLTSVMNIEYEPLFSLWQKKYTMLFFNDIYNKD